MPKGFRELALKGKLSIQTLRILEHISKFLMIVDHAFQGTTTTGEMNFLIHHEPHLVIRDVYACIKSQDLDERNSIERCLCFTLMTSNWNSLLTYD
jgi:hypothetical protein